MIYVSLQFGSTTWKFVQGSNSFSCGCSYYVRVCTTTLSSFSLSSLIAKPTFFFRTFLKASYMGHDGKITFFIQGNAACELDLRNLIISSIFVLQRNHGRVYLNVIFRSQNFGSSTTHCHHPLLYSHL